ncbi:MAG: hypothetical protein K0S65_1791, partial [Labilithrix sp.]|nr:hypothetical protein [Labilithrix sp.]
MASSSRLTISALVALSGVAACAHDDPRRFRLAAPVIRDQDLDPVAAKCRRDPSPKDPQRVTCAPEDYESSFSWDAADNTIFRPISKFFQADTAGEAKNVNALDEVPDSSWFVNRIGAAPMSPEEAARGYCPAGPELVSNPSDGAWLIDHGKDNGANPGFRVAFGGTKFMMKTDDTQIERATAATAIASRMYYAAGWWAPCDAVVYFKRSALKLTPGLMIKANVGPAYPFDEAALGRVLAKTGRRGDSYRATASRWVPGRPLGPFTYEGKRDDDPSDVIDHEDRRDLRGARVIAAWLNHFDSREQNTMSTWLPRDPSNPRSPGHVRHWYIDLGDCFGSEWAVDGFSKRHGHSYILDFGYMAEDFATLGAIGRPWDHAHRTPGAELFGYFTSADFDPDGWRGEYPNPAFGRMTERDAAWAARIIARFTPEHVAASVHVGDFTDPAHERFLTRALVERQRILLRRYFSKLSPITDVSSDSSSRLCAVDLARRTGVFAASAFAYSARVRRGRGTPSPARV